MQDFLTFVSQNLLLFAALAVTLVMLFFNLFGSRLKGYQPVNPTEAVNLINRDNALVLDVREVNEYQSGHILNARHIPQSALPKRLDELEKDKDRPIILVCRSGSRSSHAAGVLKKHGFEKVYNLSGGIMAWQNANLPLTRK